MPANYYYHKLLSIVSSLPTLPARSLWTYTWRIRFWLDACLSEENAASREHLKHIYVNHAHYAHISALNYLCLYVCVYGVAATRRIEEWNERKSAERKSAEATTVRGPVGSVEGESAANDVRRCKWILQPHCKEVKSATGSRHICSRG